MSTLSSLSQRQRKTWVKKEEKKMCAWFYISLLLPNICIWNAVVSLHMCLFQYVYTYITTVWENLDPHLTGTPLSGCVYDIFVTSSLVRVFFPHISVLDNRERSPCYTAWGLVTDKTKEFSHRGHLPFVSWLLDSATESVQKWSLGWKTQQGLVGESKGYSWNLNDNKSWESLLPLTSFVSLPFDR